MSCDDIIVKAVLMPVCFVVCCCFFIVCFYAALSERIKIYIYNNLPSPWRNGRVVAP